MVTYKYIYIYIYKDMSNTNNKKRTKVDTDSNIDITKIQTKKVKLEYKQEKKHNSDHIISTSNTNKQLKKWNMRRYVCQKGNKIETY